MRRISVIKDQACKLESLLRELPSTLNFSPVLDAIKAMGDVSNESVKGILKDISYDLEAFQKDPSNAYIHKQMLRKATLLRKILDKIAPLSLLREYPLNFSYDNIEAFSSILGDFMFHRFRVEEVLSRTKRVLNRFNRFYFNFIKFMNMIEDPLVLDCIEKSPQGKILLDLLRKASVEGVKRDVFSLYEDISIAQIYLDEVVDRFSLQVERVYKVPAKEMLDGFYVFCADLSRKLGRAVNLKIEGGDVKVDGRILMFFKEIIEELIENSLKHGIEDASVRREKGKDEKGNILVSIGIYGNQVQLVYRDDGKGVDVEDREKNDLFYALTCGGGLKEVREMVEGLRGEMWIESKHGFEVVITVPASLFTIDGMLVTEGGREYILPANFVEETFVVSTSDLVRRGKRKYVKWRNKIIPFVFMGEVLQISRHTEDKIKGIVLRYQHRYFAVGVENFIGTRRVVVKSLGDHLGKVKGVLGCTILGDGVPVLILDVPEMMIGMSYLEPMDFVLEKRKVELPVLLVNEFSTSKVLERTLLKEEGFYVEEAKPSDYIGNLKELYSAAILDLDFSKDENVSFLKKICEHVPVVAIASSASSVGIHPNVHIIHRENFSPSQFINTVKKICQKA